MADLNLIIYFYPVTNDRVIQCTAVNCTGSPDFHIIAYANTAELGNLYRLTAIESKTKTIRAKDHGTVQDHPVADQNVMVNSHIGV